ncbi:SIMPL domain-containing protein [Coralloluteibacterium stylophorae]|uniref:SIMPL domain-containing protein n=1 Tax=Coralloluteibacterium stylophorae TaxID=1776034 RepID=A0A8J7VXP0_9GAMM|nr:SIMPL domain-containing protein [Coralloluteibacterium stylophorae]MBS7457514.1 SIMPL domain-containing protein [Coralloluteibacterium stylophorae]
MTMGTRIAMVLAALLLAVGLAWGGSYVGRAAEIWRDAGRSVAVKGLAEREVAADRSLWPLHYTVTADDLVALQAALARDEAAIRAFLEGRGFAAGDIAATSPQVTDRFANLYGEQRPDERYAAEATVLVRTARVDAVKQAMPHTGELVRAGVVLSTNYEYRTEFLFTALEAIKPEMIAEATADARRAAEQFAEDSGSRLGTIRNASQGYFSIEDLDSYTPDRKRVRVVTTIDYALED